VYELVELWYVQVSSDVLEKLMFRVLSGKPCGFVGEY